MSFQHSIRVSLLHMMRSKSMCFGRRSFPFNLVRLQYTQRSSSLTLCLAMIVSSNRLSDSCKLPTRMLTKDQAAHLTSKSMEEGLELLG